MKQKWVVVFVLIVTMLVLSMFVRRPKREGMCAAAKELTVAAIANGCAELGGVVQNGQCTCPDGTAAQ